MSESPDQHRPAPRVLTQAELSQLLGSQHFGVLAAVRATGHPHLSTVAYVWDPDEHIVRISSTADRLKVRQLRRNPSAALHVGPDAWSFAVAEGEAEISAETASPGDSVGTELLSLLPLPDPTDRAALLEQFVAERRVVIRLRVQRLYGTALDMGAQN